MRPEALQVLILLLRRFFQSGSGHEAQAAADTHRGHGHLRLQHIIHEMKTPRFREALSKATWPVEKALDVSGVRAGPCPNAGGGSSQPVRGWWVRARTAFCRAAALAGASGRATLRTATVPAVPGWLSELHKPLTYPIREAPAWGQVQGRTPLPPRATPFSPPSSRATPQALAPMVCSPSGLTSESQTQAAETRSGARGRAGNCAGCGPQRSPRHGPAGCAPGPQQWERRGPGVGSGLSWVNTGCH